MPVSDVIVRARLAYRPRLMKVWLVGGALLVAAAYGVIALVIFPRRETMEVFPYHYTIYFGIDRIGAWYRTFMPAYLASALWVVNAIVVAVLDERDRLVARLTAVLTLVFLGLTLLGAVFVALLNLS